jgi:hypothetical protein
MQLPVVDGQSLLHPESPGEPPSLSPPSSLPGASDSGRPSVRDESAPGWTLASQVSPVQSTDE